MESVFEFPGALEALVADFLNAPVVKNNSYKEDWTRAEYIEPLFTALGWHRLNPAHITNLSTGFVREVPLTEIESARSPDYGFYVNGRRKFFVEAKKPSINISLDEKSAFQIRHYGWSAQDDIGILTNFKEFVVYNCRVTPQDADRPDVGRIEKVRCDDYKLRWDWFMAHLSPNAVSQGSLQALTTQYKSQNRLISVDQAFLAEIEGWREALADSIFQTNQVSERSLSTIVQALIDRIVFLRIAEARGLENEGRLRSTLQGGRVYPALFEYFEEADTRYNSGLFHFRDEKGRDEPDKESATIQVSDAVLRPIIERLTSELSPYKFSVLPSDILGQIYERFLGREIQITGNRVVIDEKPEIRKSGGVFYTPSYIVDYIVDAVLEPILKGKSVEAAKVLRIVDPACGSGSFLISAYQKLLDWYQEKYSQFKRPGDRNRYLLTGIDGKTRLRLDVRKRILLDNIFGVDIDSQAVEVTKLSLLLKVIEGELQTAFSVERLLPDLDANIVCGNSLVGSDFYTTETLTTLVPHDDLNINPFDWKSAFPKIAEKRGFDAVIGNPPWLMAGYYVADSMSYFRSHYESAAGKVDLYYLFVEKAIRLVNAHGRVGMIVPSKLFHTQAAKNLRGMLANGGWIEEIVDFGTEKIFSEATNYSCILTLSRGNTGPVSVIRAKKGFHSAVSFAMERSELGPSTWHLIQPDRKDLWNKLRQDSTTLEILSSHFGNGVQSGADKSLILSVSDWNEIGIEPEICQPILRGRNVRRFDAQVDRYLLFPYDEHDGEYRIMDESTLGVKYPHAYSYLLDNRSTLEKRKWFGKGPEELSGSWYGMMYLDSLAAFSGDHLVTPALASVSSFALDSGNLFVTGTAGVSSIALKNSSAEFLYFVLGVLNSNLISEFLIDHSTPYQGGYFKFSAPYIRMAPIRTPNPKIRSSVQLRDDIASLARSLSTDTKDQTNAHRTQLISRLNDLVCLLYEVTDDERAILERQD